jgi:probable phosphoglycerate mutase
VLDFKQDYLFMITTLYLIRHGETYWNREKRLQGQLDSDLTDEGIRQAERIANKLNGICFNALYSSDLKRAIHTAHIISKYIKYAPVIYDKRLRERNFGLFQGYTWREITEKYPAEAAAELSGDPMNEVPGGESKIQLLDRAKGFFADVILKHAGKKILVISHGGIINIWTKHVLHVPLEKPRRFSLDNAALNVFEFIENVWYVKAFGIIE